jgi:hypothetical protein
MWFSKWVRLDFPAGGADPAAPRIKFAATHSANVAADG